MKIKCQACGKRYDTDTDELCPYCGSYNPIGQEEEAPSDEASWHERAKEREEKRSERIARLRAKAQEKSSYSGEPQQQTPKEAKKTGCAGCGTSIAGLVLWIVLVVVLTGPVRQLVFTMIREKNDQQSTQMKVVEIVQDETYPVDGEMFGAGRCVNISIETQQEDLLKENGYEVAPGMQLTAVELKGSIFADFYLKVDDVVYREVYSWELNQMAAEKMGLSENSDVALFLTPVGSQEYQLCVREMQEMDFASDDRISTLVRIPLQVEEV